jgi:hypothetical protein
MRWGDMKVKICNRCFREFAEDEHYAIPVEEFADIFLRDIEDINSLCPQCREELGIVNLLGFNQ